MPAKVTPWAYTVVKLSFSSDLSSMLATHGAQGWELAWMGVINKFWVCVFKRLA